LGNYGGGFSHPDIIARMLVRPNQRHRHIQNIRKAVLELGYDGVDLDYENLPPYSRKPLTNFVRELADALDAEDKVLDITVPPKFSAPGWKQTRAFDWQELPLIVNRVNVMCYDWYIRSGPPGPIIPLGVTKKVIAYIKTCPNPERFWIGHPTYGNDWVKRKKKSYRGRYYGGLLLKKRARKKGAKIFYQSKPKGGFAVGPFAHYSYRASDGMHTVWYGDHKSLAATIHVVRDSGLGGIFVWRIGFEDPQIWEVIRPSEDETSAAAFSQTDDVYLPAF
jgi:spore germination protein YaaH